MISLNDADRELYRSRRKQALDEFSRRAESFSTGRLVGRIQLLQSLLGQEETSAAQLDALAIDDLRQMELELKVQLANRS